MSGARRQGEVETIGDAQSGGRAIVRESDSHAAGGEVEDGFAGDSRIDDQARSFFRSDAGAAQADRRRRRAYRRASGQIAKVLDFHVTVIDDRLLYANRERFPAADEVLVGDMAQMLKEMTITPSCYIVLITRGHAYDEPCLREIIHSKAKYIGMIGSRRRIKACFQRFRDEEKIAEEVIERVYAPIGLDIATETPAEIALSILGEVIKIRRGGKAASLSGH